MVQAPAGTEDGSAPDLSCRAGEELREGKEEMGGKGGDAGCRPAMVAAAAVRREERRLG